MKLKNLRQVCGICGKAILPNADVHVDHIIPRSKGGPLEPWNERITHSKCNERKSDTIVPVQLPNLVTTRQKLSSTPASTSHVQRSLAYQQRQVLQGLCYRGDGHPATHGRRCNACYQKHLAAKRKLPH